MASTVLKTLLRERHWQRYGTFCKQYDRAAATVDDALVGAAPSRAQFARWLSGSVRRPHPDHCRVLEAMFSGQTATDLFAVSPSSSAQVAPVVILGEAVPGDVPSLEVPHDRVWPTTSPLGEELAMSTDESARFVRQVRGTVDSDVIDQLNGDVNDIASKYMVQPPYLTFIPLTRLRREVFDLLDKRQRPTVLPDLYRIAGQLCILLAHASLDLGQAYAAETHARTAWLCADMAEENQLRTYTRWVQSNIAYWNGQYRQAADIAQSGQEFGTSGTGMLRLASQEARACAAMRDQRAVESALSLAAAARESADATEDHPGGIFSFDPGKAAYYASEVRLALGGTDNIRRAIFEAEDALTIFAEQPAETRCAEFVAAARIDAAQAHAAIGGLDGVDESIRPVLSLASENRTLPIAERMARVGKMLTGQEFAGSALATDLRERIDLFNVYTATRELPST